MDAPLLFCQREQKGPFGPSRPPCFEPRFVLLFPVTPNPIIGYTANNEPRRQQRMHTRYHLALLVPLWLPLWLRHVIKKAPYLPSRNEPLRYFLVCNACDAQRRLVLNASLLRHCSMQGCASACRWVEELSRLFPFLCRCFDDAVFG